METTVKLEKVKKSCKIAEKVMVVLSIIMIVGCILALIGGAFCLINRANLNAQMQGAVMAGNLRIPETIEVSKGMLQLSFMTDGMIERGMYAEAIAVTCFTGALICLVGFAIFRVIYRTFLEINQNESPFVPGVQKRLKVTFILISVFLAIVNGLGVGICVAVILWSVYCIFDYGSVLQKQYDETL